MKFATDRIYNVCCCMCCAMYICVCMACSCCINFIKGFSMLNFEKIRLQNLG